ncbi:MAG: indolepyruvate ferredoxin oxidoreductase [Gemmatimonadetes bacterium]|nr:indolepyruvate ferredoxin oxidoreductase [Gemmatimonadota bacterium]
MDPRFTQEKGISIFTGNELIVKGGLESSMGLLTGYPGSPVAEVFDAAERVKELMSEKGIMVQIANNEALGAARLNGSQMEPIRAMAVMKSVGAHVASDGLALGNMAGTAPGGAAVAVFGDDTWSEGTQVPADSRFIARHLYMPVLEPSTFQEIKDWIGVAFDLSEHTRLYLAYLITSNQADGGGTVQVNENRFPDRNTNEPLEISSRSIPVDDRVIIPPHTAAKEHEVLHERFPDLIRRVRELGLNQILYPTASGKKPIGFVTSSLAYCYLEHVLNLVGLSKTIPILKYGMTYPMDRQILGNFVEQVEEVYVVEEKRGFLEEQINAALFEMQRDGNVGEVKVWGKQFPGGSPGFPQSKGMNPSIMLQVLAPVLKAIEDRTIPVDQGRIDNEVALSQATSAYALKAAVRTPSFCPGCPHRDSASVLNRMIDDFEDESYMKNEHGSEPVDLVFHGDIGCYSLLKYRPFNRLMHNLSGMGLGGGTGAGIDPFITNKQLVFMGDSTFFHSGMAAISDSIKHGQDIAYVILDNKTTAMTGHQPTPGVDVDIMGRPTFAQDIEQVIRGMAGSAPDKVYIARMDPSDRETYRKTLEEALLRNGVKIIVADKECGITYHRRAKLEQKAVAKAAGYIPEETFINITPEVCEYCLECTRGTGCSGLTVEGTIHGPKIATDLSLCVADGACTKLTVANGDKTCPSFEEIVVKRKQAPQTQTENIDLTGLPDPEVKDFDDTWYAYIAGVGGMGINTISAILSVAGARQGYTVRFTNKKGLAIRNGAVYSHVSFTKGDGVISQLTPYGHANLLFGLDILEAVRGLDPEGYGRVASPEHTTAVVETGKRHTIRTLTGEEDFDPLELEELLKQYTNPDTYFGMDLGEISERFLGNKIYANSILLGVAYQRGALPLTLENIHWAVRQNIRKDLDSNLKAFDLGRKIAFEPSVVEKEIVPISHSEILKEKSGILDRSRGKQIVEAYVRIAQWGATTAMSEADKARYAQGVYDVFQWGGEANAIEYGSLIASIYTRDSADLHYRATGAAVQYLARVMTYKDEIYVAHLLTSEEKKKRDQERYLVDPKRGDRIAYRHLTRPHFQILGYHMKFDIKTRDWMLKVMAKMKFLRKLLPAWHREEKNFRNWYMSLVSGFRYGDVDEYENYVRVLELPNEVRGYREVIWPKMEAAYKMSEFLLNGGGEPEPIDTYLTIEPAQSSQQDGRLPQSVARAQ